MAEGTLNDGRGDSHDKQSSKIPASFIPGHTWELADVIFHPANDSHTTLNPNPQQEIEQNGHSIPYFPEATYHSGTQTMIDDDPLRFTIQDTPFAKGGAAIVFKGFDRRLEQYVAIKCLTDDTVEHEPNFIQGMEREAKVMANIRHPNIAMVYEFMLIPGTPHRAARGIHGPLPTIIMEYLDPNTNLSHIIRNRGIPPQEIAELFSQVASALDYMDERGIHHRDLNPNNLFWDGNQAKIIDFGLASTAFTPSKSFGTVAFISPEHVEDVHNLTIQSEVFALASNVYYCLTKEHRFHVADIDGYLKQTLENDGFTDARKIQVLQEKLAGTGIDYKKVVNVLDKAQKKQISERYQTATEFAAALKEALTPQ
jgi:serine/threonine protein kinase